MDSKENYSGAPLYDDTKSPEGPVSTSSGNFDVSLDDELPVYSRGQAASSQPILKKFDFTAESKGKVFATLSLLGDQKHSKIMPTIVEGSPLAGRVRLNLERPDSISSIVLNIKGYFGIGGAVYNAYDEWFLDIKRTLWSQSEGEPQKSTTHSPASGPTDTSKFKSSLQGEYTWPFSVELPKEVKMPLKKGSEPQPFHLPQSFAERYIRATIRYTASVKITRSGLFKSNDTINASFGYMANKRPGPFSPLRQVAYEEGTPLLGPIVDSDGWHSEAPIVIEGTLFKTVPVEVECTLFLAKPLAYTQGSAISLSLCLRSESEQVLDLLSSSPKSIHVRLRHRIQDHIHVDNALESSSFRDALDYSQRAVWWSSTAQSEVNSGQVRFINGELHLKVGMSPTCNLANFKISYSVMLYDFEAPGLEFPPSKFLLESPIEICNFYGPGPRPKFTTPHNTEQDVPFQHGIVPITDEFSKGFY